MGVGGCPSLGNFTVDFLYVYFESLYSSSSSSFFLFTLSLSLPLSPYLYLSIIYIYIYIIVACHYCRLHYIPSVKS